MALGSSATEGAGPDAQDESYPADIAWELQQHLPEHQTWVLNKGIGGQTAYEMLQRMDEDVIANQPALLIWDTALIDVLHDVGEDMLARVLRKGIQKAHHAGMDVLLMDLQWLPRENRYPHYNQYRSIVRKTAADLGITVIPRYALMKTMAKSEQFALADPQGTDVLKLLEHSNQCLGRLVAHAILSQAPPPLDGVPNTANHPENPPQGSEP